MRDFSSISSDLHKLQATQASLLQRKTAIDVTGTDLAKRQNALNQLEQAHNTQAAEQQKRLEQSKSQCNNKDIGENTPMHVNDCDNQIKKLNQKTGKVNAIVLPLQSQQAQMDLEYAQYNLAVNTWRVQEQQTMMSLNILYRALNDWADQADDLMGSAAFRDQVAASHADKYCHHSLPDGVLSIDNLESFAADADRCLRYIETQRSAAATHGA